MYFSFINKLCFLSDLLLGLKFERLFCLEEEVLLKPEKQEQGGYRCGWPWPPSMTGKKPRSKVEKFRGQSLPVRAVMVRKGALY